MLLLHAYQSYLFNEVLGRWIERHAVGKVIRIPYPAGQLTFWRALDEQAQGAADALRIPLAGPRIGRADAEIDAIFDALLSDEGVTRENFTLKGLMRTRLSSGRRQAIMWPADLAAEPSAEDELSKKGRRAVRLSFELPPGAYATILLKRLTYDMAARKGGERHQT